MKKLALIAVIISLTASNFAGETLKQEVVRLRAENKILKIKIASLSKKNTREDRGKQAAIDNYTRQIEKINKTIKKYKFAVNPKITRQQKSRLYRKKKQYQDKINRLKE